MSEPFEDSRRLTGCNLYFAGTGAALEASFKLAPGVDVNYMLHATAKSA